MRCCGSVPLGRDYPQFYRSLFSRHARSQGCAIHYGRPAGSAVLHIRCCPATCNERIRTGTRFRINDRRSIDRLPNLERVNIVNTPEAVLCGRGALLVNAQDDLSFLYYRVIKLLLSLPYSLPCIWSMPPSQPPLSPWPPGPPKPPNPLDLVPEA